MSDEAAPSSDFSRIYCWAMLLVSLFLGYMLYASTREANAFEQANELAKVAFGGAEPSPQQEAKPTQIRHLGVGVLKYIETFKAATLKGSTAGGVDIPIEKVRERARALGLEVFQYNTESPNKNQAKGYVETSLPIVFEKTDLLHLATFLYNFEVSSTSMRILEVKWDLLPEKENPAVPGPGFNIQRPSVKIGIRRPIAGRER